MTESLVMMMMMKEKYIVVWYHTIVGPSSHTSNSRGLIDVM